MNRAPGIIGDAWAGNARLSSGRDQHTAPLQGKQGSRAGSETMAKFKQKNRLPGKFAVLGRSKSQIRMLAHSLGQDQAW